jgi:hypothetical protein
MARVAPLKKPTFESSDVKTYRPVSLSFLYKTLERAVSDQHSHYLSQNDHLDPNQDGSLNRDCSSLSRTLQKLTLFCSHPPRSIRCL